MVTGTWSITSDVMRAFLMLAAVIASACQSNEPKASVTSPGLVLLSREGCVMTETMRAHLVEALRGLSSPTKPYQVVDLDTLPPEDVRRGYPTPTLLYDNRDVFGLMEPKPPFPEPT